MKLLRIVFFVLLLCAKPGVLFADNYVIALSPHIAADDAKAQASSILEWAVTRKAGDVIEIIDAYNVRTIGTFKVPEDERYRSPRARLGANSAAIAALLQFAKSASIPSGQSAPTTTGAIRLPQVLRHIASNISSDTTLNVAVFASPAFDDPSEPTYSMAGGPIFPSDGHIKSSRGATPYGTSGLEDTLANVRIHFGVVSSEDYSDQYDFFVERFWTLYVESQGGSMVTFTSDLQSLFVRLNSETNAPQHDYELSGTDKLEMLILRPRERTQTIFEREVQTGPLPAASLQGAQNVQIGLSWDCGGCDLDLYARPYPDARILYFGEMETAEGRYWKDFRVSPSSILGYETIEFTVPLDLRRLQLLVNFYEGSAPDGVRGELRISVNGATYAKTFHMEATNGNEGAGVVRALESNSPSSAQMLFIDPIEVLHAN